MNHPRVCACWFDLTADRAERDVTHRWFWWAVAKCLEIGTFCLTVCTTVRIGVCDAACVTVCAAHDPHPPPVWGTSVSWSQMTTVLVQHGREAALHDSANLPEST